MNHRMARTGLIYASAALLALLPISACSDANDKAGTKSVDTTALQPGSYPTEPRNVDDRKLAKSTSIREAVRLAESMPLAMEVDKQYVYNQSSSGKVYAPEQPPQQGDSVWVENFGTVIPGLVVGWTSNAQQREEFALGRNIDQTVLRFSKPDQAEHAAKVLSEDNRKSSPAKRDVRIPGHDAAISYVTEQDSVATWMAHEDLMIYTFVTPGLEVPPDVDYAIGMTKTALDKNIEMLAGYNRTPTAEIADLPVDTDGLLGRTLPVEDLNENGATEGVYPPHAALHLRGRADVLKRAFDDAGVDLMADAGARVYRSADSAAADRLVAALVEQLDPRYEATDAPAGLPEAKCFKKSDRRSSRFTSIPQFQCLFTNDRYVAVVDAAQIQDLHQKAAAQYLLLTEER
ncbi:DUF7373 family lipoprotein [Nocardia cyriacigeorgica]|nr:hypothetical protein [Nocardia cyriacigeorgica]